MKIVENILPLKEWYQPPRTRVSLTSKQKQYVESFNNAVLAGEVKFEAVRCLCDCEEFDLIARYDRYSMRQDTVICRRCGLILSNPRMTEEEYARFYERDIYRECYDSVDYMSKYRKKYNSQTGQYIFDMILKIKGINQIKTVMEFGAGGGWNLITFKDKGISVVGYDYSSTLVTLGREYGLNMLKGSIDDINGKYDVIILNHVLEHFTDPRGSLRKLKEHLNPDGIFFIAVPDIKYFDIGQLQNAHTFYFTLSTLQYYLSQCGLSLIRYESAQTTHLAAIFIEGKASLKKDLLISNYRKMRKIIQRYRWKRYLIRIIQFMGLKK